MLYALSFLVLGAAALLPFLPFVRESLHFVIPTPKLLLFIGVLTIGYFFATEAVKSFYYRHVHEDLTPAKRIS